MAAKPNLFIQTAFLGDLCLSVAALKHLKKISPQSPLWLVARNGFGKIFADIGIVDKVFEIKKGDSASYEKVHAELQKVHFQWIVCPHESLRTAFFLRSLKAEKKVGFKKVWNFPFFTDRIEKPTALPEAFRQMSLLQAVDKELTPLLSSLNASEWTSHPLQLKAPPEWCQGEVMVIPSERSYNEKPMIAVFPGSVWATKKWTQVGFITLCKKLAASRYQVVLMGSSAERTICDEIQKQEPSAINVAGEKSLLETLGLLKSSQLAISNDSGGSHLASLVNTPTISIFGPTVLAQGFRPWVSKGAAIFVDNLSCRPCGRHGHQKCPIGTHECMKSLTAETVFAVAQKFLQS